MILNLIFNNIVLFLVNLDIDINPSHLQSQIYSHSLINYLEEHALLEYLNPTLKIC